MVNGASQPDLPFRSQLQFESLACYVGRDRFQRRKTGPAELALYSLLRIGLHKDTSTLSSRACLAGKQSGFGCLWRNISSPRMLYSEECLGPQSPIDAAAYAILSQALY